MKLLVTILALSLSVCGNAQLVSIDWQNCYGGSGVDANATVRYTTDGGFLLIGRTESNDSNVTGNHGLSDVWATKLDSAGNLLWQRALGGTANDLGISVQETNTGYVIAGQTMSNDGDVNGYHGGIDGWIVKLDLSGTLVWQKCLGGSGYDILRSIRHTVDGGFIAAGWSASSDGDLTDNNGLNDYWLVKLDSAGAIEWQKSFGGTGNDEAYNIDQTTDGGFVLAGRTNSNDIDVSGNHGDFDYWVIKVDALGSLQWQKCLGGSGYEIAYAVLTTTDGGCVVTGTAYSTSGDVVGNHGSNDVWIVKLDNTGTLVWQKCLGGTNSESAAALQGTPDGGFVFAGNTSSNDGDVSGNSGNFDYWVVKTDAVGTLQWQRTLGGTASEFSFDIVQMPDGKYVVGGYSASVNGDVSGNHGSADVWVVKLSVDSIDCNVCMAPTNPIISNLLTNTSQINWSGNNCAVKYRVRIKNMSTGQTSLYFVNAPDTIKALTGLSPNTLYKVRVRSQCSPTGTTLSPWSSPVYFTTLASTATVCVPPSNPSATATSNSTAAINWTSVSGANGYQLRYRIQGTTTWTPIVINNGLATATNLTGLQASTTYQYQLRTKCAVTPLTWSSYSAIQTFATPLRLGENDVTFDVALYPNPADGVFTLSFTAEQRGLAAIEVFGVDGRRILLKNALVETGFNAIQMDGTGWSAGAYVMKLSMENFVLHRKLVLN